VAVLSIPKDENTVSNRQKKLMDKAIDLLVSNGYLDSKEISHQRKKVYLRFLYNRSCSICKRKSRRLAVEYVCMKMGFTQFGSIPYIKSSKAYNYKIILTITSLIVLLLLIIAVFLYLQLNQKM